MRRLTVIHNPTAGGWRRRRCFRRVLAALERLDCRIEVLETAGPGNAEALAQHAAACDVLVVAGGDGTINEVLNGLRGRSLPLAVIPLGTANVLAHELGLPRDPEGIARTVARGTAVPVHLGEANGRRFALMAGAGFDAHVVARVDTKVKRLLGKAAYVLAALAAMCRFGRPSYRVLVDGRLYHAASVIVAKAHRYGGTFVLAPGTRPWRPDFQVVLFERGGVTAVLRYALALVRGDLHRRQDVRIVPGRRVRIDGAAAEPVQLDGDRLARLPAEIRLLEGAAAFVVPEAAAAGLYAGSSLSARMAASSRP